MRIAGHEWLLGERIGSGGFGTIYVATCDGVERIVKLVPHADGAIREIRLADELREVPNVLPVIATGTTDTHYALLMLKATKSLRQQLDEAGPRGMTDIEALPILKDISRALDGLWRVRGGGVIHRDLKPENILLLNGRWHLADFGISRFAAAATAAHSRRHHWTGEYAAPELWRSERATFQTDVYAFGIVAHELLSGRPPFSGHALGRQHLQDAPPILPDVSVSLTELIRQCLEKEPTNRPLSSQLIRRLEEVRIVRPVRTTPYSTTRRVDAERVILSKPQGQAWPERLLLE